MIIGVGYYSEQQYSLLLRYADDRKSLDDTWEKWLVQFGKTCSLLKANGIEVEEVDVDVNHLLRYCHKKGLKNTGETRSRYVQGKVSGEIR
jgi:hypothetical protein